MRLTELQGYKALKTISFVELLATLHQHGYKIAHGAFAIVLCQPGKSYVYRVWTGDSGYWKFLERARQHPSPHIVKLLGDVKTHTVITGGKPYTFNIQKMEKLTELTNDKVRDMIQAFSNVLNELGPKASFNEAVKRAPDHAITDNENGQVTEFYLANKSFFTEVLAVATWGFQHKVDHADISPSNVMKRVDGELVITDPYYQELANESSLADDLLYKTE